MKFAKRERYRIPKEAATTVANPPPIELAGILDFPLPPRKTDVPDRRRGLYQHETPDILRATL